ncbi:MAG TPA: aldose epimerase family protein, partial [Verrucomicrobiae bacterium]
TLRNRRGMEARIMNFGGIVVSLRTPDRHGQMADVVLGFDRVEDYLKHNPCFGTLNGRYANRIGGAQFSLEGATCRLAANNGRNHLHGGWKGFDKVIWTARAMETINGPALHLSYLSKDGEEGYPGNLSVRALYTVTEDNALTLDYLATTDKTTVCNLTHHSYFNLAGQGDVLGHIVEINADHFTPTDAEQIPTGEIKPVAESSLDFRSPRTIGARIGNRHEEQIRFGCGYDHNFVLNKKDSENSLAARVHEPVSGRVMEVWTTEPGVQFYTANHLDGTLVGKGGTAYQRHAGFCFEPQHFPNSPNCPAFPSTVLCSGAVYHNSITYKFNAK